MVRDKDFLAYFAFKRALCRGGPSLSGPEYGFSVYFAFKRALRRGEPSLSGPA